MKKLLTFFLTALLAFSVGWAETVTFVGGTDVGSTTNTSSDSMTKGGITISSTSAGLAYSEYRFYNGTITISSTVGDITSVVFTCTSNAYATALGGSTVSEGSLSTSGATVTWTGSSSSFTIRNTTQTRASKIVVTYESGSTVEENWYRKVTSTSDLVAGKKYIIVNEANGVGMGELNTNRYGTGITGLTFEDNRVDIGGTSVMELTLGGSSNVWTFQMPNGNYLSDGNSGNNVFFSSASVQTSANDITKWTITPGASACAIQSNYATNQYIRFISSTSLFGTYGSTAQSDVALYVEDDGTVSVANIAEALAFTGTTFRFMGNAVVTYQNGNYLWIRDASGSGLIYGSLSDTFDNGDVLDAGWTASNTTSGSVPQFTSPSGVSSSSTATADPEAMTTFTTTDVNKYISISNVTITRSSSSNYYFEVNGVEYCVRNQFNLVTLTVGMTYNVEGVVSIYNNEAQLYLTAAETVAVPTIIVNPSTLTINDSGTGNTFAVEGSNLGTDNVGVTVPSGSEFSTYTNDQSWGFNNNNGSVEGTVTVTYNGRALSASEIVTAANNLTSATVAVNYVADLYIVADYGSGWDFSNGVHMTNNNGTYTASVTIQGAANILFARKLGESNPWNTRYVFGPSSDGDWWLPTSGNGNGNIDLYDDDPIYIQGAGTYIITIDANAGTFTITTEVVNEGDFVLVTDASQLNPNDEVIIVNSGTAGAARTMGQKNNNNYYGTAVEVLATKKVAATDDTQIFTLESGTGGWYFKTTDNQYLTSTTGNNNNLQTKGKDGNGTSTSLAAITVNSSDNEASIVFQGEGGRKHLRYNANGITSNPNNNDIFSCYASGNMAKVYIYRRTASTPVPSITVNPSSLDLVIPVGESSVSGTVTVTESNTTGTTSVAVSGTGANYFSATLENGTLTVTYSGNATMTSPDQATITLTNGEATATVTVTGYKRAEATGTLYSKVTNANQIQDGLQYILVYENENAPVALNNFTNSSYTGGTGTTVAWAEQGSIVNISGTDAIEFTLENGTTEGTHNLYYTSNGESIYLGRMTGNNNGLDNNETDWYLIKDSSNGGYYLAVGTSSSDYRLRYNTSMSGADKFRLYGNNTGAGVYLYVQGSAVATPVITPGTGNYAEDQEVTITCSTPDATIYYTVNGGETQTYTGPFTVDVDEDHTTTTIAAWAEDGEQHHSPTVTVTYTYKKDHVSSIAEFLALDNDDEVTFDNPVVVLFDYSQNSSGGQEYIWIKDQSGYTQLFITPQFDAASVADPQYSTHGQFVPKYENGDVIPAGFKVKKNYHNTGAYYQGMCSEWHATFEAATQKALADPEQVTLSELLANPADYNNRYLYINRLQVSNVSGLNFDISADENGDNVSEVQGGTTIVGYNKYNSPAWKNKQGETVGVTLPTDNNYYNVKFIFQKWSNGYEIMPIEFTPWEETSLRLEDLVEVGVKDQQYTISNPLIAAAVTWDDNYKKFAIFAKDDEMYATKSAPTANQKNYLIDFENQDGTFVNTVEQKDYDQSNWIEILIPSNVTVKPHADYQTTLDGLKVQFENKILAGGTVKGIYKDELNPTIQVTTLQTPETSSTYTPNIFCTANFLMENLDPDGATSYRDDEFGGQYFMMDAKPQEFCTVVWAYFIGDNNYFVAPAQEGDQINGHNFHGSFLADMSLCEDAEVTSEKAATACFPASNTETPETLYGFKAIVRKNPNSSVWSGGSNGAPHRIQPSESPEEEVPAYIVYPLNSADSSSENVTAVAEVQGDKSVASVRYYNIMGVESEQPFEGLNIVVTRFTDGSTNTIKVLK